MHAQCRRGPLWNICGIALVDAALYAGHFSRGTHGCAGSAETSSDDGAEPGETAYMHTPL